MFFLPWSTIAWLEFWSEMSRAWMVPATAPTNDPRVVPFPIARVRARTVMSRVAAAQVVRLSV